MKLKDAVFWGFTTKELEKVRKVKGAGEEEMTFSDSQEIEDIVGADVMVLITPGGQITFIKAGE